MSITYIHTENAHVGLATTSGKIVALLFIRDSYPVRFAVGDVIYGGLPEKFETLKGADAKMWEIARREETGEENARRLATGTRIGHPLPVEMG